MDCDWRIVQGAIDREGLLIQSISSNGTDVSTAQAIDHEQVIAC